MERDIIIGEDVTHVPDTDNGSRGLSCGKCNRHNSAMKVLPCLHALCSSCIHGNATSSTKLSLYACSVCGFKINHSASAAVTEMLKNVPRFLRSQGDAVVQNHFDSDKPTAVIDPEPSTFRCAECEEELSLDTLSSCQGCNQVVCNQCISCGHQGHDLVPMSSCLKSKSEYILGLASALNNKTKKHEDCISCIDRVKDYLTMLRKDVEGEINRRSQHLIGLIESRKNNLLQELESSYESHSKSYADLKDTFTEQLQQFRFVGDFASKLLAFGSAGDLLTYHDDVSNVCLHQLHQVPEAKADVASMKLDIPGKGKEHSALEKLFGSLTEGTVLSGTSEKVASFNVEMKWPTSIGISPSKEIVITGKTDAFESPGKAFFFDSRGRLHSKLHYDAEHVPIGVEAAGDGTVWMTNNRGQIRNMTVAGRVLRTVDNVFRGSGQIGVFSDGSLVVASSIDKELHVLDEIGRLKRSITVPVNSRNSGSLIEDKIQEVRLTALATNSNDDLVVGDSEGGRIILMDSDGGVKFTYPGEVNGLPTLRCPSALCCDPFDNILVADFTNDCVHLFAKSGKFLGTLLTKEDGLSCPNCMALDHEGKLYIGQYGGDVVIYRYMSCRKKA